jgi:broad specificity phosphatase PhoE
MKLIITRHGETEGNVKRVLADISDPLTSKGVKQAEAVSERLKNEKIDAIFSSPIKRAKETAQIIAKHHPNAKFIIVDELKEMELGSYLNKGFDEVDWDLIPDDVENKTSLYKRAKKVIERVLEEFSSGTVLFVAHNAINKAMIRFVRKWHPEDKRSIPQGNTAISIFEISAEDRKEIIFNCTKHLD